MTVWRTLKRGSEPGANDTPGAPTSEIVDFLKGKVPV